MADPRILVVLLNYRTAPMTVRAADAAVLAMAGCDAEMVIVDNDSGDGSFETLTAHVESRGWPHVRVLQSGRNGGFGAGNNVGMRAGCRDGRAPDYFYLLNSDAFPEPDALSRLVLRLDTAPGAGIAGSRIHGEDGEAHVTAFRFPTIASEFEGAARTGVISRMFARSRVPVTPLPQQPTEVDWLAGASLLLDRRMLEEIGLFDEQFFLYFEETDLCLRAARAGWRALYVPDSRVAHIGSASTGMKNWTRIPGFWLDSRMHYFSKNHGRVYAALATLAHLAGGSLWRARRLVQRKPPADPDRFLRDLVAHDLRLLWPFISPARPKVRPLPSRSET